MRSAVLSAVAGLLLTASGCSGERETTEQVFRLSGAARAPAGTAADRDTGDPNARSIPNDSFAEAQPLPSAVTLGGWVSGASAAFRHDYYRATLAKGQVVTLTIADPDANLDLEMFDVSVSTTLAVEKSAGETGTETVTAPADGEYHLKVFVRVPLQSASNYLLTLGPAPPSAAGDRGPAAEFVPGEVIVRFKDGHLPADHAAASLHARARALGLVARAGAPGRAMLMELGPGEERARAFRALGIEADAGEPADGGGDDDPDRRARADTVRVVAALRRRADVAHAAPNYLVHAATAPVPNDPMYLLGLQWHYPAIGLEQAWGITTGTPADGEDVVVAVVDTGIFGAHVDLAGQLVAGYDFIRSSTSARDGGGIDPDPTDMGDSPEPGGSSWHGTHVAGTIGAASNNGVGVAGVSWGAKIMPIRVLGLRGSGTSYDILQGVRFAAGLPNDSGTLPARKADVINLSLGCVGCYQQEAQDVFDAAYAASVVVVAAAGNDGTSHLAYPASYDHVVSVSAVDRQLARAPYSNYGAKIDVAAPGGTSGSGVLSTVKDESGSSSAYRAMQGTSMAAPHVAGVVALMKAVCPTLTPPRVDWFLRSGWMTQDRGEAGRDESYGWGLVDALASVQAAQARCTAPVPPAAELQVVESRLAFAPSTITTAPLTVSVSGPGTLEPVTVTTTGRWLTVAEGEVDPTTKLGTYVARVDPSGLPPGYYRGSITFTEARDLGEPDRAPQAVTVPVTMHVGSTGMPGDAGRVYVLLVSASFDVVDEYATDGSAGEYPYSFVAPPGAYFIVAGSDANGDGWICDAGEACGAYEVGGLLGEIALGGDRSGLDFAVGFDLALGGGGNSWLPPEGLRLRGAGSAR